MCIAHIPRLQQGLKVRPASPYPASEVGCNFVLGSAINVARGVEMSTSSLIYEKH